MQPSHLVGWKYSYILRVKHKKKPSEASVHPIYTVPHEMGSSSDRQLAFLITVLVIKVFLLLVFRWGSFQYVFVSGNLCNPIVTQSLESLWFITADFICQKKSVSFLPFNSQNLIWSDILPTKFCEFQHKLDIGIWCSIKLTPSSW